jgi:hypothetical protein
MVSLPSHDGVIDGTHLTYPYTSAETTNAIWDWVTSGAGSLGEVSEKFVRDIEREGIN